MMMMMIIISIHWIYNPFIISIHDDDDDAMDNSCSDRLCMKTTSSSTPIQWKPSVPMHYRQCPSLLAFVVMIVKYCEVRTSSSQ